MSSTIDIEEGSFQNAKGFKIHSKYWSLEQEPRALLFILHGFAEHSGHYHEFAQSVVQHRILVCSHDHVGHGQSDGERVQIDEIETYVCDVLQHVDLMTSQHAGLPVFLFGHSMGGTIAIMAALERPDSFAGVVLSAPAVAETPPNGCKLFFARLLARVMPSVVATSPEDVKLLSRDPEQVAVNANDPLVWHGGMKARWAIAILDAMEKVKAGIPSVEWPFLILHGDADKLTMSDGSIMFHEKASSKDKTIKIYPGCYHKLLNEIKEDADIVKRDIVDWILARIPQ